jgi:hypothetical protein
MTIDFSRRRVLRGVMGGGAVTLALPFLDCMLNINGTALAGGRPLPVRFGTWNWGLGMNSQRWVPTKLGPDYDLLPELKYIEAHKAQINIFSGFKAFLDGKPNLPHISGMQAVRAGGVAPSMQNPMDIPTIDVLIGDTMGTDTRFRSLEMTATGDPKHSYSYRSANGFNPAEVSPVALYTRIFGPDFQDPNAADFKPDPAVMLRKSVLTAVTEQRGDFLKQLGQAMALACNQTKIFNVVFSDSASNLRMPGEQMIHHLMTHEEPVDKVLGYQPKATYFVERSMEAWALFVATLANIKEGDGTLLDRCLVMGHSDTEYARVHSISGIPVMTAGSAGGRIKTGLHVSAIGEPITRIGLTLQQVMGVPVEKWGQGSMQTNKPVSEILI